MPSCFPSGPDPCDHDRPSFPCLRQDQDHGGSSCCMLLGCRRARLELKPLGSGYGWTVIGKGTTVRHVTEWRMKSTRRIATEAAAAVVEASWSLELFAASSLFTSSSNCKKLFGKIFCLRKPYHVMQYWTNQMALCACLQSYILSKRHTKHAIRNKTNPASSSR